MGQLTVEHANQLYPKKSNKLYFLTHVRDGGKQLPRCLASIADLAKEIVILVDDLTSDNTLEVARSYTPWVNIFEWKHSFSYAKNMCLRYAMKHAGLQFGDWVMFMGDDFELQPHVKPEIKAFIEDPTNFFAKFRVPEYTPFEGVIPVARERKLLWRHHPFIFWEKPVHEEAWPSAFRLTGQGEKFQSNLEWKEFPRLGGENGMRHYGYHEDGGEQSDNFWHKKGYYNVLLLIHKVCHDNGFYELHSEHTAMIKALEKILNRPVDGWPDMNKSIIELVDRYNSGDLPMGLSPFYIQNGDPLPDD